MSLKMGCEGRMKAFLWVAVGEIKLDYDNLVL